MSDEINDLCVKWYKQVENKGLLDWYKALTCEIALVSDKQKKENFREALVLFVSMFPMSSPQLSQENRELFFDMISKQESELEDIALSSDKINSLLKKLQRLHENIESSETNNTNLTQEQENLVKLRTEMSELSARIKIFKEISEKLLNKGEDSG